MIDFEKKDIVAAAAACVAILLFIAAGHYFYLQPKKEVLASMEDQLKTEEQVLQTLEMKLAGIGSAPNANIDSLLQKVPVEKQLENLVLDLNTAELRSNSFIVNMTFTEGEVDLTQIESAEESAGDLDKTTAGNSGQEEASAENSEEAETAAATPAIPLPEGLQQLTATVEVTSPGYNEMMKFIEALESQARLVEVTAIEFDDQFEQTTIAEEAEKVSFKLILSAFYMPGLEDLQQEQPQLDAPPASNKKNPFSSHSDIPKETFEN